ncbi:hypothetical protein BC833DRAFT_594945 [Globomyces pollinis-pini]|nr:hypothetical protein BC833DRAFT_594945 [Globomyces pollinis-pini]
MILQEALDFYNYSAIAVLVTGILSLLISFFLLQQFYLKKNLYKLHIALLVLFNGVNMCVRYFRLMDDSTVLYIVCNWLQVITILSFEWVQYDLLKLVCVASSFWTARRVLVFKFTILLVTLIGFIGFLCARVTFTPGNGDIMDKWNRFGSTAVTALAQACSLSQGVYMTFLMKSLCLLKDKSRSDYDKYVKRSYWLLGYFVISNVFCVLAYLIGVGIRGEAGTSNGLNYHSFSSLSVICFSNQILGLAFLFESIKMM